MRSLLISLLLLGILLAVTDATVCDLSAIKVAERSEIHYDDATKTLTCVDGENSFKAIKLNTKRYDSLTCNESDGWKVKKIVQDGSKWGTEISYVVHDSVDPLNIECVEYCAATGEGIKIDKKKISEIENNYSFEISCADSGKLFYDNSQVFEARCDILQGWYWKSEHEDNAVLFRKSSDKSSEFECKKDPQWECNGSLIKAAESSKIHFDAANKTLTCVADSLFFKAIELNSRRFVSITCDESYGWTGKTDLSGKKHVYNITESSSPLTIACVEYCAATGKGILVKEIRNDVVVKCAKDESGKGRNKLFYGRKEMNRKAMCNLRQGWIIPFPHAIFRNDTTTPAQFQCLNDAPTTTTTETITDVVTSEITTTIALPPITEKPEEVPVAEAQSGTQLPLLAAGISIGCLVIGFGCIAIILLIKRRGTANKKRGGNAESMSDAPSEL